MKLSFLQATTIFILLILLPGFIRAEGSMQKTDANRRMQILDFIEELHTAYLQKNIEFIEQIFGDSDSIPSVTFLDKQEHLKNLKKAFITDKFINAKFEDVRISRYPNPQRKDFYGVTLHLLYTSGTYSDDGYLFLLWDIREEDRPQIHICTWQPKYTDNSKTQIATSEDEAFTISDFEISIN